MTQDDDKIFTIHLFFGSEDTAQQRRALHDLEEAIPDLNGRDSFRLACAGHDWEPTRVSCDIFQDGGLGANIGDVCRGNLVVFPEAAFRSAITPYERQTARIFVRHRLQKNGIDYAEDSRVRANADRNRQDSHSREARTLN